MNNEPTTTLARIRDALPCSNGYKKLCKSLGGVRTYGAHTPLTVRNIVASNGLHDALWCLRTMPEHANRWQRLALRYARSVQPLMKDQRSITAMDVADRHLLGLTSDADMTAAWAAARDAARAADDARSRGRRRTRLLRTHPAEPLGNAPHDWADADADADAAWAAVWAADAAQDRQAVFAWDLAAWAAKASECATLAAAWRGWKNRRRGPSADAAECAALAAAWAGQTQMLLDICENAPPEVEDE